MILLHTPARAPGSPQGTIALRPQDIRCAIRVESASLTRVLWFDQEYLVTDTPAEIMDMIAKAASL